MKSADPVVRANQRKSFIRGTRAQIAERGRAVENLLRIRMSKTEIHAITRAAFQIEWKQCDRCVAMARARAMEKQRGNKLASV
jgi:hypothetical protein